MTRAVPVLVALVVVIAVHAAGQPPQRPGGITPPRTAPPRSGDAPDREPTGIVRGRVIGSDGHPLRQARVNIVEGTTRRSLTESTDEDGRYEIGAVPPGTYT